jgi:hypothetical protein
MTKKIIYACAAVMSLMIYSCSVDPLEKDTKSVNAANAVNAGGLSNGNDSLKVRAFGAEMMEAADNIDKAVDKGKR